MSKLVSPRLGARALGLAALLTLACAAHASNVLIVNGASATSEPGTTASITTNLPAVCFPGTAAVPPTDTVTVVDTLAGVANPLSSYDQIWDIRFANSSPLTATDQAAYTAYLQGGGKMFVMGENNSFITRNNSILAWLNTLGGGALTFVNSNSTQTVESPFNATPNAMTTVTYAMPGGVTTPGSGQWITYDDVYNSGGAAVAWPTGTLTNAPAGSLSVVLDVNFMMNPPDISSANNPAFLQNLCATVASGGNPAPQTAAVSSNAFNFSPAPPGGTLPTVTITCGAATDSGSTPSVEAPAGTACTVSISSAAVAPAGYSVSGTTFGGAGVNPTTGAFTMPAGGISNITVTTLLKDLRSLPPGGSAAVPVGDGPWRYLLALCVMALGTLGWRQRRRG